MDIAIDIVVCIAGTKEVRTPGPVCIMGRGEDCHVRIADESVSRRHAAIEFDGGFWRIRDLDSRNGILLNRQRVNGEAVILDGDVVRMGRTEVEVFFEQKSDRAAQSTATTSASLSSETLVVDSSPIAKSQRSAPQGKPPLFSKA